MVTGELLPAEVLDGYDLGTCLSVQLLPGGKSRHYRVATSKGEYVVRRSYASKTARGVRFEQELMAHLRANGFPAPTVVPSLAGDTYIERDGRMYAVSEFVKGSGYRAGNVKQLQEVARALATYHRLVADFRPSSPASAGSLLNESLRERLSGMPSPEAVTDGLAARDGRDPTVRHLLASLPYVLQAGEKALKVLDRLYPRLPLLTIHAGCRRGSTLFAGDRLLVMLDFDSARLEARALDLAVALHDFAKIYGDPGSPEYKVPLDLETAARFIDAYRQVNPLGREEIEALPALLTAKRLKRGLGRYQRLLRGEELSAGDIRKIALEIARVRWLEAHSAELQGVFGGRAS